MMRAQSVHKTRHERVLSLLQRRASYQARKGRCSNLIHCIFPLIGYD